MNRHTLSFLLALTMATAANAQQPQGLSLSTAEPLYPTKITATGRVQSLNVARISSRVSGTIAGFGDGKQDPPDVGMMVKADDVLFRLDQITFDNTVGVAQAACDFAKANFENLKSPARSERITQLEQTITELEARIADRNRDKERYTRLIKEDKSLPPRRLEEVETEIATLTAQRRAAEARLSEARAGASKTELAVASAQVRQAEASLKIAQKDLADTVIKAPFAGMITRRFKSAGDYITNMPPAEVVELVSLEKLEVEVRLPEAYFPVISAGSTPIILRSALLPRELTTTVTRIISDIDAIKGTFAVRVAIPSEAAQRGRLVPGAFITADINFDDAIRDVIVPQRAVTMLEGKPFVFIAKEGKMTRLAVELGDRLTEGVVVKGGLKPGQKVIVGPPESLKDGAEVPADLNGK